MSLSVFVGSGSFTPKVGAQPEFRESGEEGHFFFRGEEPFILRELGQTWLGF